MRYLKDLGRFVACRTFGALPIAVAQEIYSAVKQSKQAKDKRSTKKSTEKEDVKPALSS